MLHTAHGSRNPPRNAPGSRRGREETHRSEKNCCCASDLETDRAGLLDQFGDEHGMQRLVVLTYPTYGWYGLIWFNPIDYHT